MRIAFDFGGVLGKRPSVWWPLIYTLHKGGAEVYVVTDIRDHELAVSLVRDAGYGDEIGPERIVCCDWATHGDRCKQVECERLGIDLLLDDHAPYCAAASESCVTAMVWPDPTRPYEVPRNGD